MLVSSNMRHILQHNLCLDAILPESALDGGSPAADDLANISGQVEFWWNHKRIFQLTEIENLSIKQHLVLQKKCQEQTEYLLIQRNPDDKKNPKESLTPPPNK